MLGAGHRFGTVGLEVGTEGRLLLPRRHFASWDSRKKAGDFSERRAVHPNPKPISRTCQTLFRSAASLKIPKLKVLPGCRV